MYITMSYNLCIICIRSIEKIQIDILFVHSHILVHVMKGAHLKAL